MRSFGTRSRADARVVQRVEGLAQRWRRPGVHRQRAARIFFEQRAQAVDWLQRGRRTGPCQSLSVGKRHLGHCRQRRPEHQIGGRAVWHGQFACPPPSGRRPCTCSSRSTPKCARPRQAAPGRASRRSTAPAPRPPGPATQAVVVHLVAPVRAVTPQNQPLSKDSIRSQTQTQTQRPTPAPPRPPSAATVINATRAWRPRAETRPVVGRLRCQAGRQALPGR